jgi:hypothetical protein
VQHVALRLEANWEYTSFKCRGLVWLVNSFCLKCIPFFTARYSFILDAGCQRQQ